MTTQTEALKLALEAAYLSGFNASGEGYNGEYPFGDKMQDPAENRVWKKYRDNYIKEALAQPEIEYQKRILRLEGALKKALTQPKEPEQEPVACEHKVHSVDPATGNGHCLKCFARGKMRFIVDEAPRRKQLTDDEAFKLIEQDYQMEEYAQAALQLIRRTEAAHGIKEKNTCS